MVQTCMRKWLLLIAGHNPLGTATSSMNMQEENQFTMLGHSMHLKNLSYNRKYERKISGSEYHKRLCSDRVRLSQRLKACGSSKAQIYVASEARNRTW